MVTLNFNNLHSQQLILAVLLVFLSWTNLASLKDDKKQFLEQTYNKLTEQSHQKTLWLTKELQSEVSQIIDHNYAKIRLTYWSVQKKLLDDDHQTKNKKNSLQTIWFLDKIGKEKPISFAISIKDNQVQHIKVLKFRESRGGEIQMSVFGEQFIKAGLTASNNLDVHIDGISGATMSVSAMKKITRLALFLHQHVNTKKVDAQ